MQLRIFIKQTKALDKTKYIVYFTNNLLFTVFWFFFTFFHTVFFSTPCFITIFENNIDAQNLIPGKYMIRYLFIQINLELTLFVAPEKTLK